MKVIDLLNKIANGEEVPKKIKYAGMEYEFNGYDTASKNYKCEYEGGFYSDLFSDIDGACLNNEVGVIEDNDDLELLPEDELYEIDGEENINWNFRVLKDKINELVKEINEIRKNG